VGGCIAFEIAGKRLVTPIIQGIYTANSRERTSIVIPHPHINPIVVVLEISLFDVGEEHDCFITLIQWAVRLDNRRPDDPAPRSP
jgi:hypothetical protein